MEGPLAAVCGVRFAATVASGGTNPAAVTPSRVSVEFVELNGTPTAVVIADSVAANVPVAVTGDTLSVDLAKAITTDNLAITSDGQAARSWMRALLATPVRFRLAADGSTLVLSTADRSVTLHAS